VVLTKQRGFELERPTGYASDTPGDATHLLDTLHGY
jgi:hypothetical protein